MANLTFSALVPYLVIAVAVFCFLYYEMQKTRRRRQDRVDYYQLTSVSESSFTQWFDTKKHVILNRSTTNVYSEFLRGDYQGVHFGLFLFSFSTAEEKRLRQTVVVIELDKQLPVFVWKPKPSEGERKQFSDMLSATALDYLEKNLDVWVECDGQKLAVYKERKSLTCGVPLELFLKRIIDINNVL